MTQDTAPRPARTLEEMAWLGHRPKAAGLRGGRIIECCNCGARIGSMRSGKPCQGHS